MSNKIIRSICYFAQNYEASLETKLEDLTKLFQKNWYAIQTTRVCFGNKEMIYHIDQIKDRELYLSIWTLDFAQTMKYMDKFMQIPKMNMNLDLTNEIIWQHHIDLLWDIIANWPEKTFCFTYVFNNKNSSPYFPSANYERDWFAIWLQSTDLAENCPNLDQWFVNMKSVWEQIIFLVKENKDFLGIDSSVAPFFSGRGSLIDFIKRLGYTFDDSVLTNTYTSITKFIKEKNPKPVWLCGLMFPCLEDFDLTDEYEKGSFSIERNIYLSLHSGLGIDTYPIWIDEDKGKVLDILKLVQSLSNKYNKPLSVRFVSDGKTKIWQKTDFQNQYLKDTIIKKI